jgi:translation initiation factor IF-3
VSPEAKPPVVKLMDYGKFKYEQQKKAAEARKKQKVIEIKEIKMRPTIDDHDYDTKMKQMHRFFGEGDKVKVTLRFRGREMAHQNLGMDLLNRVHKDVEPVAKMEQWPKMEGRQMMVVLAPRGGRSAVLNICDLTIVRYSVVIPGERSEDPGPMEQASRWAPALRCDWPG